MKLKTWFKRNPVPGSILIIFIAFIIMYLPAQILFYAIGERSIGLRFYDSNTDCELNGKIYADDIFIGEFKNESFVLTESNYDYNFSNNSNLTLIGRTNDCFGENRDLVFSETWIVPNLKHYFDIGNDIFFRSKIDPRHPKTYTEMQGFVRPEEVRYYLSNIRTNPNKTIWENIDKIAEYRLAYVSDYGLFKRGEYWQTPAETIEKKNGDCEDWAVSVLSLIKAYDSSLNCYDVLWPTHLSILCYNDTIFTIYDYGKIKKTIVLDRNPYNQMDIEQENKQAFRIMLSDYFDSYGLKPDERKISALFNENEIIDFYDNEDFIQWALETSR